MTEREMVSIDAEEYRELKEAKALLDALDDYGVDDWYGYQMAIDAVEVDE